MEDVLKQLTDLGSSGVQQAIDGYTRWYLVSAIGWFLAGFAFVIVGYNASKKIAEDYDEWNDWIRYIIGGILIFIGVTVIIYNISTICAPEAYAIHNFIIDIKP